MAETIELLKINLDTDKLIKDLQKTEVAIENLGKSTDELTKENAELLESQKQLSKEGKKTSKEYEANATAINNNKKAISSNKTELRDLTKTQKTQKKVVDDWTIANEKSGQSINAKRKQLTLVSKEWSKLTAEEIKNTEKGRALNKSKTDLTKDLKALEGATGDNRRQVGGYSESFGVLGASMAGAGGTMGRLTGIVPKLGKTFKGLWAILKANPVILILSLIAGVIAIIGKVLSKFQPLIDWISDKMAYLGGLFDGFMNSLRDIGDLIVAVLIGDMNQANKVMGEMGDQMIRAAQAAEQFNKVQREVGRQQILNDATTAEALSTMKELEAQYKNTALSNEKRTEALNKLSAMRKEQALDDFKATKRLQLADSIRLEEAYAGELKKAGLQLRNATDVKKALDEGILTNEEYEELQKKIIAAEQDRAKVVEAGAQAQQFAAKINIRGLSEQIKLQKAYTAFYIATNQTLIEEDMKLTEELLFSESSRLKKIEQQKIRAAANELKVAKKTYSGNETLLKEAELRYQTLVIGYRNDTADKLEDNRKAYIKQEIEEQQFQLTLFIAQNKEYLRTKKGLNKQETEERIAVISQAEKLETELLKKKLKDGLITENDFKLKEIELTDKYNTLKLEQNQAYLDGVAEQEKEAADLAAEKKKTDKEKELEAEQAHQEAIKETKAQAVDAAVQLVGVLQAIANEDDKQELKKLKEKRAKELAVEGLTNEQKAAINQRYDKKEEEVQKEAFARNKRFAIAEIATNAALAILATWAGYGKAGFVGTTIAGIQTAFIGGLAIANTAKVANQKYAEGGVVTIGGKPHSQGGTTFQGDDGTTFEAEKGENLYILKKTASDYVNRLSGINQAFGGSSFGSKKSFLQSGGGVQRSNSISLERQKTESSLETVLSNLPPTQVSVEEIVDVSSHITTVQENATY